MLFLTNKVNQWDLALNLLVRKILMEEKGSGVCDSDGGGGRGIRRMVELN